MARTAKPARHQKIVVVTGGRGRIGGAIARALAEQGHTVVVIDRAPIPRSRRRTAAPLAASGQVVHVRAALDDEAQTRRAFRTVLDRYQRIDAAVLAAGAFVYGPFLSQSVNDCERMLRDNVITAFLCLQELARTMPKTGGGRVIFMGTIVDHRVVKGNAAYGSSKAALRMLADVVREETRDSPMRITNLCLGAVASPMAATGLSAIGRPDTIEPSTVVDAALWLLDQPLGARFDELRLFPSVGVNER